MSFLSSIFLWGLLGISIPILVALWSRRRRIFQPFGAYFILRKMLQTNQKRFRIQEILKLINRIILLASLALIFANPAFQKEEISGAKDGFMIALDVGRMMQGPSETASSLAEEGFEELRSTLKKLPKESYGVVVFFSDRCEQEIDVQPAEAWLDQIRLSDIPFVNAVTNDAGLTQCMGRAESLFRDKSIYRMVISPFPNSLSKEIFQRVGVDWRKLHAKAVAEELKFDVKQTRGTDQIRFSISSLSSVDAKLIKKNGRLEDIGAVHDILDLPSSMDSILWLKERDVLDPWSGTKLFKLDSVKNHAITLWSPKVSAGFESLFLALKNYPHLKVKKASGDDPIEEPIIAYDGFPPSWRTKNKIWFFLNPESSNGYSIRDFKRWRPEAKNSDAERSFKIHSSDGDILIKQYALLELNGLDVLESFSDGAPSLMKDMDGRWIAPFNLEDLTTDLTLEPTFIPYLFRKLDEWLNDNQSKSLSSDFQAIWTLPGVVSPSRLSVQMARWPGIYGNESMVELQLPVERASGFLDVPEIKTDQAKMKMNWISIRESMVLLILICSLMELVFCAISTRRMRIVAVWLFCILLNCHGIYSSDFRSIPAGVFAGIDSDRKSALQQLLAESARLSNLEFDSLKVVLPADLWRYPFVVFASDKTWGPFSAGDRELIRDYCERGGLIIFDDPLAASETRFYKSVVNELKAIFPGRSLTTVPKDSVIFRSYYLLDEVSGRRLASPQIEGLTLEDRWVVLFSFNDLLGSVLRSSGGDFAFSVSPYGMTQRQLARRLLINFFMYGVTLNYKDDAIHLPHILKRRVK